VLNREFMQAYYQTYNAEDPVGLRRFYRDDVVMQSPAGEIRGPEAILDTYRQIIAVFEDRMTPERIDIDSDTAVVQITDRFTARVAVPDFLGRSFAPGDRFDLKLVGHYRYRDGAFAHIQISPG